MSTHESISPNDPGADDLHRLLIVDDDRDFVESLAETLRNGGYEVATATRALSELSESV